MTQLESLFQPSTHLCHVCAAEYRIKYNNHTGYPLPPCCPACDAPMRTSQVPLSDVVSYPLLLLLGGAPSSTSEDSSYLKLAELRLLQHARTCADVDAIIDEMRAACSWLLTPSNGGSLSNDPYDVAIRTAEDRLREQLDSGLLEWRLNDLREQTIALLRAEHEHHQYVYAARRDNEVSAPSG